jgi:hypothetical protein
MPIVTATGSASGPNVRAKAIEEAMAAAVVECAKEGITDPDVIRRRKLEAREKVKRGA